MWYRISALLLFLLSMSSLSVLAQDNTCTALVEQAISDVQDDCSAIGRNQACYGNTMLEATPREGVQNFSFENQGDLANIIDLESLHLSALDTDGEIWGVAMMNLQANLPDSLPGQNVTFLLFGNVSIENAVPVSTPLATVEITSSGGINIRSGPSTNAAVAGSLTNGEIAIANGRNQDSSWLRIQIPDSDSLGWVFSSLAVPASDVTVLSVVDPADTDVPLQPMQAFRYSTGVGSVTCTGAPPDGILIQTPEGAGKIELRANDVEIQLGSTAYLQAQPGANMTVSVLEGEGIVTAEGVSVTIPAGAQVDVPVDENLQATGQPSDPRPYDTDVMQPLPVQALPIAITIAAPATEEQLQIASQPPADENPHTGSNTGSPMTGMQTGMICAALNQALAEEGISRDEYISTMNQALAFIPADQQADMRQVLEMVSACP